MAHANFERLIIRSTPLSLHCICFNITRIPVTLVHSLRPSFSSYLLDADDGVVRIKRSRRKRNSRTSTDPVNFEEQRKDGICEAAVSCRRYAISRTRSSRKRVRGWEVLGIASGPLSREFHPLTPPPTMGTRRARRNGEKVAALSKRRCSRVEDSRGTTLRERHSGIEHAAAPYSPWNCACVLLWSLVWVVVRVYVWPARLCAREFLPYPSVVYQSVSPPPQEPPPFYPVAYLARIPLSFFFFFFYFYFLFFLFLFCALFLLRLFFLADFFLISTPISSSFFPLLLVGAGENRSSGPIRTRKSANPVITYGRDN